MALPENRVGKPSSRTPGARQTNPQHHFRAASAASSGPLRAGKSAGGFNRLPKVEPWRLKRFLQNSTGAVLDKVSRLSRRVAAAEHPMRRSNCAESGYFALSGLQTGSITLQMRSKRRKVRYPARVSSSDRSGKAIVCRVELLNAPQTSMDRGGDFSTIYKMNPFVEEWSRRGEARASLRLVNFRTFANVGSVSMPCGHC